MNTYPKILVIEDRKDIWENLIKHIFPEKDYEISWKNENFENFKVEEHNIQNMDVIICDYYLKNIKGPDVIKQKIKSLDPEIPIVFWTSSLDPHVISQTIVGDSVFLKKELKIKIFKEEVDKKIALRRANKYFPLYNEYFNSHIGDEELRKSASMIYKNASRYLESFFAHSRYHSVFNAHGLIHIQRVIDNLANLLKYAEGYDNSMFSDKEYYALYVATLIHDLGMIPDKGKLDFADFQKLRKMHCKKIFDEVIGLNIDTLLSSTSEDGITLVPTDNTELRFKIAIITLYHDCNYDFIDFIDSEVQNFSPRNSTSLRQLKSDKNLKLMSGLLALADKLDYGITRIPVEPSRSNPLRSMRDEFEYLKNEIVSGYEIISEENNKIIQIKLIGSEYNDDQKEYFDLFKEKGFDSNGNLTVNGIRYAQQDVRKMFDDCWAKLKPIFEASNSDFLKTLNLNYLYTDKKIVRRLSDNSSLIKNINTSSLTFQEKEFLKHSLKDINVGDFELIGEGLSAEKSFYLQNVKERQSLVKCNNLFLKFGRQDVIYQEIENYKIFATRFVPPHLTIGQIEELKFLDVAGFLGNVITTGNKKGVSVKKFIEDSSKDKVKLICHFIEDSLKKFYKTNIGYTDNKKVINFYKKLFEERYQKDDKLRCSNVEIDLCYSNFKSILYQIDELNLELHFSFIHGDFTFRNILYTGDNIVFIDFANSGWGHYFFDFAKLEHFILNEMLNQEEKANPKIVNRISQKIWRLNNLNVDNNFNIQKLLAILYMKLWCLKYDKYTIPITKRVEDFNESYSHIINKVGAINNKRSKKYV